MITLSQDRGPMRYPLIVNDDGRDILVQVDTDYPGVASSFGWSVRDVIVTGRRWATPDDPGASAVGPCDHDGTDGTVDCRVCGLLASEFIESARDFLDDHIGATADDPGYFDEGEYREWIKRAQAEDARRVFGR